VSARHTASGHQSPLVSKIGKVAWPGMAQAANALSNLLLTVSVARVSSAGSFGGFALSYGIFAFVLSICQALVAETLLVTNTRSNDDEAKKAIGAAAGVSALIGAASGSALLIAGLWWQPGNSHAAVWLGLVMPFVLVQDTLRQAMIGRRRARPAALNDATWLVMQLLLLVTFSLGAPLTDAKAFMAWGAPAVGVAILACVQTRAMPHVTRGIRWLRQYVSLATSYAGESLVVAGSAQATLFVVGLFGGLPGVGALRAAQTIFGPLSVAFVWLRTVGLTEAGRSPDKRRVFRYISMISIAGGTIGSVATVAFIAMPNHVGSWLFGSTWPAAMALLLPIGIQKAAIGVSTGSFVGLRVSRQLRTSFLARASFGIAQLLGGSLGAFRGGAAGCAWGLASASALECVILRYTAARAVNASPYLRSALPAGANLT
jgi:O-antigen/teichoic acid export membrane protein